MGGQATKSWDYFNRGNWPLETPSKDFYLAIGGCQVGWND